MSSSLFCVKRGCSSWFVRDPEVWLSKGGHAIATEWLQEEELFVVAEERRKEVGSGVFFWLLSPRSGVGWIPRDELWSYTRRVI
jgi:hypothetical protein